MRALLAPLFSLTFASVDAQTTAGPDASPAVAPLEQAKRELEASKVGPIKEGEAGLRDLRAAVSPMPLPAAPASPPPKPRSDPRSGSDQTSRNWLVEAMERKPGAAGVRGEERAERTGRELVRGETGFETEVREREELSASRETARGPKRDEREQEGERKREKEVNPFAGFLKDWVSPQDFALLQSTIAAPREAGVGKPAEYVSAEASDISSAVPSARPGDAGLAALFVGRTPGLETPPPRGRTGENPFLQFLQVETSASRSSAPAAPNQPNAIFAPVPPAIAPSVPPTPRSLVPDFVRPIAEDKLYRQLKRF